MLEVSTEGRVARRRAETSARIIDAAWQISREQGLAALSLRDLAQAVGMRAPSLYSYFSNKDEIYDAMFEQGQRQLREVMGTMPEHTSGREWFRAMARTFFDFCTADPVRYQLMFQRVVPGFVPSETSYALAVETLSDLRSHMAAAGISDPRIADLATAVFTGLTDQQISNDPGGDRWGRLVEEAADLLCNHAGLPA